MTETSLLPCPFCGCVDMAMQTTKFMTNFGSYVECLDCGARRVPQSRKTREEAEQAAIERWNTRHDRTCHDAREDDDTLFECTACGCEMEVIGNIYHTILDGDSKAVAVPSYCPVCGAKVVSQ